MFAEIRSRTAWVLCASSLAACAVYDNSLLSSDLASGGATAGALQGDGLGGEGGGLVAGAGASSTPNSAGDESSAAGEGGEAGNGGAAPAGGTSNGGNAGSVGKAGSGGSSGALGASGSGGNAGALEGGASAAGSVGVGGASAAGSVGVGGATAGSVGVGGAAAGSGGAVSVVTCSDHALSAKSTWVATASHQSSTPKNPPSCLVDGANTRWSSGKPQSGDEWVQVDFGTTVSLRGINLQQGADTNDYPRSYAVIVSDMKNDLTGIVRTSGVGTSGVTTTITLPKVFSGRYLLIKQLGSSLSWWSVAEVEPSCTDG